ncbi:MAG TPA: hypothetical protein VMG12_33840 [Polyangiaceae bacterium]|nr:hypothetical protein [Polyangiaceae bacterium]
MSTSHAFVLSLLALGVGCGENVLIGNWKLRSLSADAGVDEPEPAVDAGPNKQWRKSQGARERAEAKSEQKPERASQHVDGETGH